MTASYRLFLKASVEDDLRRIPAKDRRRIDQRIGALGSDPRPPGCQKLAGSDRYRVRQGDYRIVYTVDDEQRIVMVYKVQDRREVYRD